ncbi:hypothetical protein [Tabrizicola sp.]|uniref:hypothetical protein n=1 Tax=Tabrizicola sp. TaxID=2005166 RepID=UPI00286B9C86|nr:hypothetical protein [Tabrizicola sp.]
MASKKLIRIVFPTNTDGSLTHQVRNLGEDLWREVEATRLGDVGGFATIDRATDTLLVTVYHTRKVGRARAIVQKLVAQHLLTDRSQITFE